MIFHMSGVYVMPAPCSAEASVSFRLRRWERTCTAAGGAVYLIGGIGWALLSSVEVTTRRY